MIVSLAELLILCLIIDWACRKIALPGLVGMMLVGVVFGPYALGWISPALLTASDELRLIALIVILLRAGFELSTDSLNWAVGGCCCCRRSPPSSKASPSPCWVRHCWD